MKKSKKALTIVGCVVLAAAVGAGIYFAAVRHESKKHNLITVDTSNVEMPEKVEVEEGDVELSEMTMHYEVYGKEGHPVVLVHGNGGSCKSLSEAAKYLSKDYVVYAIDSRCHGKSSDPGVISYDLMAKDLKEFIEKMKLEKPYMVGHSDGGINALTVAYTYPDLLGAVVSFGANSTPDKMKPYFILGVKIQDRGRHEKLNELMLTLPQMNEELLSKITCPTYIVAGEYDIMYLSDTVFLHESIKNSEIAIIKGADHSSYASHDGLRAAAIAKSFFTKL